MKRPPKTFQLLGHTLTVKVCSKREWEHYGTLYDLSDADAYWSPSDQLILLQRLRRSRQLHDFCHETLHAMLDMMGSPMSNDEAFVDLLAGLFAQMLETAK
jgi:hypothetical protein